ncbi:MAG: methyltransferase domain-containing protein [Deltaproteobacteria bacterium]|nr:methyltransferase domain-containing protein [Deltaproteobacteria bacterium]
MTRRGSGDARARQERHWRRARYRSADDPVALAYAQPKLDLVERVLPLADRTVLDVGCGVGLFTRLLRRRARLVVATDLSPFMLRQTDRRGYVCADACRLPFADRAFDVALAANLLHHTDRPQAVVDELARVARTAVVLIEPNRLNPIMAAFALLVPAERRGLRSSRRFLRSLVQRAGLRCRAAWCSGWISQNNTPGFLVPWLRRFDGDSALGEYHVLVAARGPAGADGGAA